MCASDVAPVLVMVDEAVAIGKRADFESLHKCRDFSKIKEWMWNDMALP